MPVRANVGSGIVQSAKIIFLCVASAVVYGICHDQVTARVCVEYFTVGHPPVFTTASPTLLALAFGITATWWVGLVFGMLAASVSRAGPWPKLDAAYLIRPIACLLIVMAVASLLAGVTACQVAEGSGFVLPEPLTDRVPKDRHYLFFADTMAHLAAYAVGAVGGLILCAGVLAQRRRIARAPVSVEQASSCTPPRMQAALLVISRWTARSVGIPLFVLLVLLTLGDGIPNPFTASPRERLFLAIDAITLSGLVLAWKWEGVGSLLILGALALFAASGEPFLLNIVLAPWLVTGLAYLMCWILLRRMSPFPRPTRVDRLAAIPHQ